MRRGRVGFAAVFASVLVVTPAFSADVEFPGVTRYGTLDEPVRLSQFRGETVVLAFFFRVRTPG